MTRPTTQPVQIPRQRGSADEHRPDPSVLVIVPTGDRAGRLPAVAARLRAAVPGAGLLVVDDGSPDGAGHIADALTDFTTGSGTGVHVLHRRGIGVGTACVAGFTWALDRGYDVIVQMDADGSHAPADLPRLLAPLGKDHVVIGSRYAPGGGVVGRPRLVSKWGNGYARAVLGLDVRDVSSGYRALRAEVVRALPLRRLAAAGPCFPVELVRQSVRAGFRVREVPITCTDRGRVDSPWEAAEALCRITRWALPGGDR